MMTLQEIGVHAFNLFWAPVLVWSVLAGVLMLASRWLPRSLPQLHLDLSVALLLALPASLCVAWLWPEVANPVLPQLTLEVLPAPAGSGANPVSPVLPSGPAFPWLDLLGLLSVAALSLSVWATVRLTRSWFALQSVIHDATPLEGAGILQSDSIHVPFSAGLFRHWIVLPADVNPADRETIIRHEQSHHAHGDLWRTWVSTVMRALFAFHPLVHWLHGRAALFAEICCDRRVLDADLRATADYAHLLLRQAPNPPRYQPAIALVGPESQLRQRIEAMKSPAKLPFSRWHLGLWMATIMLPVALLAGCSDMEVGPTEPDITDDAYDLVMDLPAAKGNLGKEVFAVVEDAPMLLGGLDELQRRIQYPEIAKRAGVEGRVFLQFVVDQEGNVVDPQVIRGIGAGCDEEALRALQTMKFVPGVQSGERVNVKMSLPVTFRLDGGSAPTELVPPPFSKEQLEAVTVYTSVSSVDFPYEIAGGTKGPVYEGKVTEGMLRLALMHGATAIVRGGSEFDYIEDAQLRSQMTDPEMFVFLKPAE